MVCPFQDNYRCSNLIDEVDVGNFSVSIGSIIEILIFNVVFSSVLEVVTLGTSGRQVDGKNFLEDGDFLIEVSVLVIEFFGGNNEVVLSAGELSLDGDFLRSASSNVSFIIGNDTLESDNVSGPLGEFSLVHFDFVFKLQLVISGGSAGIHFVFLTSLDLFENSFFETSEDG